MAGSVPSDSSDCRNSTSCTKMVQVGTQALSLRAAVEALPPEGGILELPAGHFTGSGSCGVVVRQSNVTIRGSAGPLETVIDCAGRDRHMVLLGANISLERLRLVGGAAARSCATSAAMGLSCSLDTNGGCLLVAGGPAAVRDCRLEGCAAPGNGGGVAAYGPLTLERVQVEGCSSVRGGGVYSRGEVKAVNSSLERNSAWQGGGIFVEGALGVLAGQGVALVGNTAQNSGGGLHAEESARIRLGGRSTVRGNTAGANGGGINLYLWAELVLEGEAEVAENLVTDESNAYGGGGVCGDGETRVELRARAAVVDNMAFNAAGGGLRLTRGSGLVVKDDAIIGRNMGTLGGGLYFAQKGTINVSGRAAVENNSAIWWNGGGFYLSGLSYNHIPISGQGAIFLNVSGTASFRGNSAVDNGGAICASGRSPDVMRSHVVLTDDVVMEGNSGTDGGAIYLEFLSSLITDGRVRLAGNSAGRNGGAIMASSQATVDLGGHTVLKANFALRWGGAIGVDGSELTVRDNVTIDGNSARNFGGGIAARSSSIITLRGAAKVQDNCGGSGGGIYAVQGCTLLVADGVQVVKNQAVTGGGIFAQAGKATVMDDTVVSRNDAALQGGGIFLSAASLQVEGAVAVEHNRAGKAGGGLYLDLQSKLGVNSGVIDDNTAGPFLLGTCAAALASTAGVTGGNGSSAGGGIFATDNAEVTLKSGAALRRNSAGAGGAVLIR
jgi:predicted outer membrane repeat protein